MEHPLPIHKKNLIICQQMLETHRENILDYNYFKRRLMGDNWFRTDERKKTFQSYHGGKPLLKLKARN